MEQRTRFPGVYRIGEGRFRVRAKYKDPRTDHPAEVDRKIEAPGAKEARAQLDALVRAAKAGDTPQRMRLSEYAASWLEQKAASLQPSTLDRYARSLRRQVLPVLGEQYVDAIETATLVRVRDALSRRFAPATVNSHWRILKELFADAAFELRIHDPAARVRGVSEAKAEADRVGAWDGDELGAVLTALLDEDPDAYTCILLKSTSAMRWSEVSAVRWTAIDFDAKEIEINRKRWKRVEGAPKTGSRRIVPLQDEVIVALRAHRATLEREGRLTDVVFPGSRGARFRSRTWLAEALDRAIAKARVPRLTPHGLRHTWNDILSRVASPEVVRSITGHVTERMRLHYRHVDAGEKAEAQRAGLRLVGIGVGKEGQR